MLQFIIYEENNIHSHYYNYFFINVSISNGYRQQRGEFLGAFE